MAKHANKSSHLQLVDLPKSVAVQVPLPVLGALASAENAFFDLCIDVGQQVFSVLMEQDREALCGPKGKHDADRSATRAGSTSSDITLGGRRIPVRRLRARSLEGEELALPSFVFAADRDPLNRRTMEAMACGVSTRRYPRSLENLPEDQVERSTSKSAVSRRFVALSRKQMTVWLSAPLSDLDVRVLVIDGIVFHDHTVIIVLGIDSEGKKHVLGLREGTTENSAVAKALFRDLLDRGLDPERARLFVVDGSKALHAAIRKVFGPLGVFQRCQIHKRRNILEHLPEHRRARVDRILREAWDSTDVDLAKRRLENLASSLEPEHPGAAASIREGLEDTLTLQGLGIEGSLYRTLRSTNTIENLNGSIATYTRNVKRWQGGSMILRWASAAVLDASKRFRRIRGYRGLAHLIAALESIESEQNNETDQQVA
jgi:transposase-like protein